MVTLKQKVSALLDFEAAKSLIHTVLFAQIDKLLNICMNHLRWFIKATWWRLGFVLQCAVSMGSFWVFNLTTSHPQSYSALNVAQVVWICTCLGRKAWTRFELNVGLQESTPPPFSSIWWPVITPPPTTTTAKMRIRLSASPGSVMWSLLSVRALHSEWEIMNRTLFA